MNDENNFLNRRRPQFLSLISMLRRWTLPPKINKIIPSVQNPIYQNLCDSFISPLYKKKQSTMNMKIVIIGLTVLLPSNTAFQSTTPPRPSITTTQRRHDSHRYQTILRNVPLPSLEGGATPEEIKRAADKIPPPSSFYDLQLASVRAAEDAIRDGYRLLEVEVSSASRFYIYHVECCHVVEILRRMQS